MVDLVLAISVMLHRVVMVERFTRHDRETVVDNVLDDP